MQACDLVYADPHRRLDLSFYVQICVCKCVCMHTRTYTCWHPNYPYSHTHMEFCAVILRTATHICANEFQLKVLAISVPTFRKLTVSLCLPMTLCGHICVLVRHCVWLRCPDSGAKTCVIHIERPHLFDGCDSSIGDLEWLVPSDHLSGPESIILVSTSSHRRLPALLSSPCPRSQSPVSNGWGLRAGTRFWREQAAAGASPGCPVVKTVLPRQGTLVQALVGKPRSRMPCGMAKKKPIFWFKVAVVKAREKVVLKNQ